MKFNVGDLIQVKPPVNEKELASYQKGIGYVKTKYRKPQNNYRSWIVIQWIDEPVEIVEYSIKDIEELFSYWNVYPIRKK